MFTETLGKCLGMATAVPKQGSDIRSIMRTLWELPAREDLVWELLWEASHTLRIPSLTWGRFGNGMGHGPIMGSPGVSLGKGMGRMGAVWEGFGKISFS